MAVFSGLALLPDIDVLGLALGLPDDDGALGHRGLTHSLVFAGAVAALTGTLARRMGARPWPTALLSFVALTSHGLLDALTYDSRGAALFWPFSDARVLSPWRPIPGAPTGFGFLSRRGVEVGTIELIYFAPLIALTLLWRRPGSPSDATLRRAALRCCVVGVAIVASLLFAGGVLRNTALVAWLERPSLASLAAAERKSAHPSGWRQLRTRSDQKKAAPGFPGTASP